jgi:hypothetical protein
MFVVDDAALALNSARLYLEGKPTGSLAEQVAASKVIDLSTARVRLRPSEASAAKDEVSLP